MVGLVKSMMVSSHVFLSFSGVLDSGGSSTFASTGLVSRTGCPLHFVWARGLGSSSSANGSYLLVIVFWSFFFLFPVFNFCPI